MVTSRHMAKIKKGWRSFGFAIACCRVSCKQKLPGAGPWTMDDESPPPYEEKVDPAEKSRKLFFVGGEQSRNSSSNSLVGEEEAEASVELLSKVGDHQSELNEEPGKQRCKISGSCMCKLSVVFYLATCILISALYVAFFGKNQAFFGDAWIPGKVRAAIGGEG